MIRKKTTRTTFEYVYLEGGETTESGDEKKNKTYRQSAL